MVMADFLYVFRGGMSGSQQFSPEQMQKHLQAWGTWIGELSKRGQFKGGDPLDPGGKQVKGKKKSIVDGPFAEAKDLVGGYLLVTPDNPAARLRTAARNRALDLLRKERTKTRLSPQLEAVQDDLAPAVDAAFTEDALRREQLRMMFACCAPRLQPPVQVALVLKLLCGFGVDEVAHAFLASPAAIEKRLARGKAALRRTGALAELAGPQLTRRLEAVLEALYLLFNEGYHGAHPELAVRAELCAEAIRLARLLTE